MMASNQYHLWNGSYFSDQRKLVSVHLEKRPSSPPLPPTKATFQNTAENVLKMTLTREAFLCMQQEHDSKDNKWLEKMKFQVDGSLMIDVGSCLERAIIGNVRCALTSKSQPAFQKRSTAIPLLIARDAFVLLSEKFGKNPTSTDWHSHVDRQFKFNGFLIIDIDPVFELFIFANVKVLFIENIPASKQRSSEISLRALTESKKTSVEFPSQQYPRNDVKAVVNLTPKKSEKRTIDNRSPPDHNNLTSAKKDFCRKIVAPVRIFNFSKNENLMMIFMKSLEEFIHRRENISREINKLKGNLNSTQNSSEIESTKIKINKLNNEKNKISWIILKKYSDYSSGDNLVLDLHGLMISELNIVLPQFFRHKLDHIGTKKKITAKIITGIGATIVNKRTSVIRTEVVNFFKKKKLHYEEDGPGAFKVTLSSDSQF